MRCECCGDEHGDVGMVNGMLLCFLCQPCPDCGETGGACDPYGGPAGNSNLCVNGGAS